MPMTLSVACTQPGPGSVTRRARQADAEVQDESRASTSLGAHLRELQPFSTRQHFERDETIFHEGDRADRVYRVISGMVRICRHTPGGARHIADFILPGELIGFADYANHPFSAEAVTPVTMTGYTRSSFERLAATTPAVRMQLVSLLTEALLNTQNQLFILGSQAAKQRVASFLLRLADRADVSTGERLDLDMGRLDIADHLGMTIETVCRVIAALRDDRIVTVPNSHQLILNDLRALRALAIES
ncbi:MAG: Crp/Fnr family transcriptional regulator [Rhizomicrobium sp.]